MDSPPFLVDLPEETSQRAENVILEWCSQILRYSKQFFFKAN